MKAQRHHAQGRAAAAIALLVLAAAGCGGSKPKTTSTAATAPTTTTTHVASADPASANSASVSSGPVHATLTGPNHDPVPIKAWYYTVRATSAGGQPLSGTVETDFVISGLGVVGKEAPPVHALKHGLLRDKINFPTSAIGHPLNLVTVIHTSSGSVALAWPVTVKKS